MFGLFRPAPLGVDLGTGSVKVIGLNGKKISLAAFMDIPSSDWEDESLLTGRLKNFFKEINIAGKDAVVHMPGHLSFVRTINLPPMPKGELKEAVKWEIKRQLPYPTEEAVYDYIAAPAADGIVVTFASAERKNVQRYISPFKEGARSMEIDIIRSESVRLTRTVELGGEQIKNQLISEGFSEGDIDDIMMNGPAEKMKEALNQFLREIFLSIDYYKATFKEKVFSEVILTGGVVINHAVRDYFSQMLDIPVGVPNPFDNLVMKDESLRPLGPRFSVAIGLARRAA